MKTKRETARSTEMRELRSMLDTSKHNSVKINTIEDQIFSLEKEKEVIASKLKAVYAKTNMPINWKLDSVGTTLSIPSNHIVQLVGHGSDVSGQSYFLVNPKIDGCETYLTINSAYIEALDEEECDYR